MRRRRKPLRLDSSPGAGNCRRQRTCRPRRNSNHRSRWNPRRSPAPDIDHCRRTSCRSDSSSRCRNPARPTHIPASRIDRRPRTSCRSDSSSHRRSWSGPVDTGPALRTCRSRRRSCPKDSSSPRHNRSIRPHTRAASDTDRYPRRSRPTGSSSHRRNRSRLRCSCSRSHPRYCSTRCSCSSRRCSTPSAPKSPKRRSIRPANRSTPSHHRSSRSSPQPRCPPPINRAGPRPGSLRSAWSRRSCFRWTGLRACESPEARSRTTAEARASPGSSAACEPSSSLRCSRRAARPDLRRCRTYRAPGPTDSPATSQPSTPPTPHERQASERRMPPLPSPLPMNSSTELQSQILYYFLYNGTRGRAQISRRGPSPRG